MSFYYQFIFILEGVLFTFMRNYVVTFAKSLVVGSTMLVPGVSGGSMAMILGIYTKLISSVSSFMKNKFRNSLFNYIFSRFFNRYCFFF